MDTDVIEVMLCVNDQYGNDSGICRKAEFRWRDSDRIESMLELECDDVPFSSHYSDGWIELDNRVYQIQAYGTCVGNIFWDMVNLSPNLAVAMINQLCDLNAVCTTGFSEIFDKYNRGHITEDDIYEVMPF